ncbi:unnamed protein product [Cercospora beticola]|nr:unnamed protein product [Cercospora beticola]
MNCFTHNSYQGTLVSTITIQFTSSIADFPTGGVVNALACYWNYTTQSYSTV